MGMESSKYGGMERFNVALAKKLQDSGYQSLFIYESYPSSADFVRDLTGSNATVYVSNSRKHPLRFCLDFIKIIAKYRPVIVHAHFTKALFYAVPLSRLMGVKRVFFTIHSRMDPKEKIKPLTRLWYWMANRMARIIAVSDNIAVTYKANWPSSLVKRIYLGVESPKYNRESSRRYLDIPEKQTVLLTVANFNHIKGLDILVKAVSLLVEQGRWGDDSFLYVVGQTERDIDELKSMIDSLGIGYYFRMMGISNEVPYFMAAADIYIQPSRSEGLPLAMMEAASYSLPLIGSDVGGIPEIIKDGENGILVPPEDEVRLADAILRITKDSDLRSRFSHHSCSLFKTLFSIENGVSQLFDYYCS